MVDAADLKSASRKRVGVRVPSWAPLFLTPTLVFVGPFVGYFYLQPPKNGIHLL